MQRTPHPPQFLMSFPGLTQAPLQQVRPRPHGGLQAAMLPPPLPPLPPLDAEDEPPAPADALALPLPPEPTVALPPPEPEVVLEPLEPEVDVVAPLVVDALVPVPPAPPAPPVPPLLHPDAAKDRTLSIVEPIQRIRFMVPPRGS